MVLEVLMMRNSEYYEHTKCLRQTVISGLKVTDVGKDKAVQNNENLGKVL